MILGDCDAMRSSYCDNDIYLGADWNYPEINCCNCGKDTQGKNIYFIFLFDSNIILLIIKLFVF